MKKKTNQKSPSISRVLTERWNALASKSKTFVLLEWKFVLASFISGVLLVGIGFAGLRLSQTLTELAYWQQTKHQLVTEMTYWQDVVAEYPEYRDGWFKLSLLSYQLGDKEQASQFMKKVFAIDPNYEQGKVFVEQTGL